MLWPAVSAGAGDLKPFVDHVVGGDGDSTGSEFIISLIDSEKTQRETEMSPDEIAKLQRLRTEIQLGVDQLNQGEFEEFNADDIIAGGRARTSRPGAAQFGGAIL